MLKFHCEQCGELETVEFDGYAFGDRELEGVFFIADKSGKVTVRDDSKDYMKKRKHWLKEAKDYIKDVAAQGDSETCPKCRGDCTVSDDDAEQKPRPAPLVIPMTKFPPLEERLAEKINSSKSQKPKKE